MKALNRLYEAGVTRNGVVAAIERGTDCRFSLNALRLYERGKRFPPRKPYAAIVALAESHGVVLLASDFVENGDSGGG